MSEKMIPINGKEFSESTIANALEKQCGVVFKKKYPIVFFASFNSSNDRLVIRITPEMKRVIKEYTDLKQIVICKDGTVGDWEKNNNLLWVYKNEAPVFGEIEDE